MSSGFTGNASSSLIRFNLTKMTMDKRAVEVVQPLHQEEAEAQEANQEESSVTTTACIQSKR
jgi:hypothetical protein